MLITVQFFRPLCIVEAGLRLATGYLKVWTKLVKHKKILTSQSYRNMIHFTYATAYLICHLGGYLYLPSVSFAKRCLLDFLMKTKSSWEDRYESNEATWCAAFEVCDTVAGCVGLASHKCSIL